MPRVYLTALACFVLLLFPVGLHAESTWLDDPEQYRWAQNYMLQIINDERARAGLNSLRLDSLASQAAKLHADEMLAGQYLSHWNLQGQKPTRRFNLLGGFDALSENVYYYHGPMPDWQEMVKRQMEVLMDSEGHRAAILDPSKTHVGLGFAADDEGFYSAQEFIGRMGGEYKCRLAARVGETVQFSGRFDPLHHSFSQLLVAYEPPEEPRERKWLENTGSYSDGDKLVAGYTPDSSIRFVDIDTFHSIEVDEKSGTFRAAVVVDYKGKPGMYYLMLVLTDRRTGESAAAATVAVAVGR